MTLTYQNRAPAHQANGAGSGVPRGAQSVLLMQRRARTARNQSAETPAMHVNRHLYPARLLAPGDLQAFDLAAVASKLRMASNARASNGAVEPCTASHFGDDTTSSSRTETNQRAP